MKQHSTWSVGRVAKRCGVNVSTLHFYEEKGLIKSRRNQGNHRQYNPEVIRRISVIKAAQTMGISLDEIKSAFSTLPKSRTPTKEDWQKLSQTWHDSLNQKIARLTNLRDSLTGCIGCGCLSLNTCPIYNPEDTLSSQGPGPVILEQKNQATN